jgi:hypothetical protein
MPVLLTLFTPLKPPKSSFALMEQDQIKRSAKSITTEREPYAIR